MDEANRQVYIGSRLDRYEGFLPQDWAQQISDAAKPSASLDPIVMDLVMAWRTTAYTASMPAVLVKSLQSLSIGYMCSVSPDSTVIAFADTVIQKVSRKVPELVEDRQLRSKLVAELASCAQEFRDARAAVKTDIPVEPIWEQFLSMSPFQLAVWSSQRVSFVSFYNAYEAFLVKCAKHALGVMQLRATDKDFKSALRTGFSCDVFDACWGNSERNTFGLVRHALSHADGRLTDDLKKQAHGITVVENVLQIIPDDNHRLLRGLRAGVEALVAAAVSHPRFK